MIDGLKKDTEKSMQRSVESFIEELKKIRTGRANVSMLDNIMVNYYGNPSALKSGSQRINTRCKIFYNFALGSFHLERD